MDGREELLKVNNTLLKIAEKGPMWQPEPNSSWLATAFYSEWAIHYRVTWQTVVEAHCDLTKWYAESTADPKFKDALLSLALGYIKRTAATLDVNSLKQFVELSLTILESAARLSGLGALTAVFETRSALRKIKATLEVGHTQMDELSELLIDAEAAMETMLLLCLYVSSQVAAITKRGPRLSVSQRLRIPSITELKAPVVLRIKKEREILYAEDPSFFTERVSFCKEGFWPPGFRESELLNTKNENGRATR